MRAWIFALCTLVAAPAGATSDLVTTDLVINGSFEEPALADGTWDVFATIRGWRTGTGAGIEIQRGVAGAPLDGAQHVELDSHDSSSMYQILDTAKDTRYLLSYFVSARPGTSVDDNAITVAWDVAVVDQWTADAVEADTAWHRREVVVTARGRESRLELADASASNGLGAYVDRVSVVPMP